MPLNAFHTFHTYTCPILSYSPFLYIQINISSHNTSRYNICLAILLYKFMKRVNLTEDHPGSSIEIVEEACIPLPIAHFYHLSYPNGLFYILIRPNLRSPSKEQGDKLLPHMAPTDLRKEIAFLISDSSKDNSFSLVLLTLIRCSLNLT